MLRWIAVLFSFVLPGAGHVMFSLYPHYSMASRNRYMFKKGVYFILAFLLSTILTSVIIGFFFIPIIWIWALIDTYKLEKSAKSHYYASIRNSD